MGVQKSKQKKLTFVKMKEGKFFIKDDPEPYDEVEGYLTDIGTEWAEFEQGKKTKVLYLLLEDGNGAFKLTFNWDSIATTNLVKFLKSADLSKELAIVPALKEVDGVKKRSIFVRQNGSTLKAFYSKDHPNGLPQLKQTKFKGELKWDNGEQLDFLENVVNEEIGRASCRERV